MKTIVPSQQTGTAIEATSDVTLNNYDEAVSFFNIVKQRLQRVDHWHEVASGISATFKVVDSNGANLERAPLKGDYFKIDIPGPGSKTGAGFDWVVVEKVVDDVKTATPNVMVFAYALHQIHKRSQKIPPIFIHLNLRALFWFADLD